MKDEHIIEILDNTPLSALSAEQTMLVQTHSQTCEPCRNAYRAALIARVVIQRRTEAVVEPSPFFQTRVMAALRDRQAAESVPAIVRLWRSAGALISSMAVTTAALAVLSFMVPGPATPQSEQTASGYSAESVLLDQGGEDTMSYEQVLSAIYVDSEEGK